MNQGREMSAKRRIYLNCCKDTERLSKSIRGERRKFKKEIILGIDFERWVVEKR